MAHKDPILLSPFLGLRASFLQHSDEPVQLLLLSLRDWIRNTGKRILSCQKHCTPHLWPFDVGVRICAVRQEHFKNWQQPAEWNLIQCREPNILPGSKPVELQIWIGTILQKSLDDSQSVPLSHT